MTQVHAVPKAAIINTGGVGTPRSAGLGGLETREFWTRSMPTVVVSTTLVLSDLGAPGANTRLVEVKVPSGHEIIQAFAGMRVLLRSTAGSLTSFSTFSLGVRKGDEGSSLPALVLPAESLPLNAMEVGRSICMNSEIDISSVVDSEDDYSFTLLHEASVDFITIGGLRGYIRCVYGRSI